MFLLNTQVDVPEHGTALWKRGSITYCYQLVPVPDRKSPARKLIGRLVSSEPDCSRMFPNERYYALRGFEMPEPDYARISKAGRPSSAVYKEGMRTYPGFALMAFAALERSGAMPFLSRLPFSPPTSAPAIPPRKIFPCTPSSTTCLRALRD